MIQLSAGHLSIQYDKGFLRYIKVGEHEILRMLYFALRDENWGTYTPYLENEVKTIDENSFVIEYDCFHKKNNEKIFKWHAIIQGHATGLISFEISGEVLQDSMRNRAGFCALHPIKECAGQAIEIDHNGTTTKAFFPTTIAADDPFTNIQAMRWEVMNKSYKLSFFGDAFETEDQRNWSDASFKTFCTPHELPFPVALKKGDTVYQKIIFTPESSPDKKVPDDINRITIGSKKIKFPSIGISDSLKPFTPSVATLLRELNLSYYRIDVHPDLKEWVTAFSAACERAVVLDLPMEVVLHLSENFKDELESFVVICLQNRLSVKYLLILHKNYVTTPAVVLAHVPEIKKQLPQTQVGAGTNFNFTELNRNRFSPEALDFVSFSINPQEHAVDDLTLIENLEAQKDITISAKALYKNCSIHASPITLRKRFNPYATNQEQLILEDIKRNDPRQLTSFCSVWTMGSIKHLTEGDTSAITYYKAIGNQGIMLEDGTPLPVFDALLSLLSIQSENVLSSKSNHPLVVDGLVFENNQGIFWNYTAEVQLVYISDTVTISLLPYEINVVSNLL